MSNFYLTKKPELFQGEEYLNTDKSYFEGWYFKNTCRNKGISFIPGISIEGKNKKSFIQVITNSSSYFINYKIEEYKFSHNPFYIKIANNVFSKYGVFIDIHDNTQNLKIKGKINYSNFRNIKTNFINPNIMGPFSYIPFMECNHAILSMKNYVNGTISINNEKLIFSDGLGYIEKDWGHSFPKSYIWCQGNCFKKSNTSFMLSMANIPFKIINFKGLICDLIIDKKEYKFTTYNNAKILKNEIKNDELDIVLKKGNTILNIKSAFQKGNKLFAPVMGKMEKDIFESINSVIMITLIKNNKVIFSDISTNCGLEVVI